MLGSFGSPATSSSTGGMAPNPVSPNYVEHIRGCFARATTRELLGHQKEVLVNSFFLTIFIFGPHVELSPSPKVHSVAWNCNGRKLASGSVDQTARVWSTTAPVRPPSFFLSASQRAGSPLMRTMACGPSIAGK